MSQYNLRAQPARDYAALNDSREFDDDVDEFHDSFEVQPEIAHPGTSAGKQSGSSSTPLVQSGGKLHSPDDLEELTAAVARARAENVELERRAEVAKLKADLHALRQRNAQLQSQAARAASDAAAVVGRVRELQVSIKQHRADPGLTARVSEEFDHLGLSSSDSEDDGVASSSKKSALGKVLKSGKTAKLTSRVSNPQMWPHSHLSLAYVSEDRTYDELTLAEFAAGYASILKLPTLTSNECAARLDHFVILMYLVTQFAWPAVQEFHAAILFEIECGRARWGDSFSHLESRLLRASAKSPGSSSGPRQSNVALFCQDFQNGKCTHGKDHYGMIRNKRKWLRHICAKCWTSSRIIAQHTEFAEECPLKSMVSASSSTVDSAPITSI